MRLFVTAKGELRERRSVTVHLLALPGEPLARPCDWGASEAHQGRQQQLEALGLGLPQLPAKADSKKTPTAATVGKEVNVTKSTQSKDSTSEGRASSPAKELSPRQEIAQAISYVSGVDGLEELKAVVRDHHTFLTYDELLDIHRVIILTELSALCERELVKLELDLLKVLEAGDDADDEQSDEEEDAEEPEVVVDTKADSKADSKPPDGGKHTGKADKKDSKPPDAPKPEPAEPPKGKDKPDGSVKEPEKDDTAAWFDELAGEKETKEAGPEEPKPAEEKSLAPAATVEEILATINREAGNGINSKKDGQEFGRVGPYYLARILHKNHLGVCLHHDDHPGKTLVITKVQGQWKPVMFALRAVRQFVAEVEREKAPTKAVPAAAQERAEGKA